MTKCKHCAKDIRFDAAQRKWVIGKKWKCGNDPKTPVKAHSPAPEEGKS